MLCKLLKKNYIIILDGKKAIVTYIHKKDKVIQFAYEEDIDEHNFVKIHTKLFKELPKDIEVLGLGKMVVKMELT